MREARSRYPPSNGIAENSSRIAVLVRPLCKSSSAAFLWSDSTRGMTIGSVVEP